MKSPNHSELFTVKDGFREIPCSRIIHRCDEFRLVEHHLPGGGEYPKGNPRTVVMNESIRVVFEREKFRLNGVSTISTRGERLDLVGIMQGALSAGQHHIPPYENAEMAIWSAEGFGREFAATIGVELAQAFQIEDSTKRELAVETIGTWLRTALNEMARGQTVWEKRDSKKYPIRLQMVSKAMELFEKDGEQPDKKAIREAMESMGHRYEGKNANSRWKQQFTDAELGDLPEG
jgi:hypothetical protein